MPTSSIIGVRYTVCQVDIKKPGDAFLNYAFAKTIFKNWIFLEIVDCEFR